MMKLIALAELNATPWKNGGGVTRELASHPAASNLGDFIWRISIAQVSQSGAFSVFPGIDRIITLLNGSGMRLTSEDGRRHDLTTPLAPYSFPGEALVQAQLIDTPCTDFNLMLRRQVVAGSVIVQRHPSTLRSEDLVALVCVAGQWDITFTDGSTQTLSAQHALTGDAPAGSVLIDPVHADSTLLSVHITFHHTRQPT